MFKNYYEILEISRNASIEVIEKAYITLAKKYHPDSNNFNSDYANETMQEINEAYDVLKSINKRNEYDRKYDEIFNNQKNNTETQNPKVETVHNANEKEKKPKSSKFEIAPLILSLMILAYVGGNRIFYSAQYNRIEELNNLIRQEEKRSTGSGLLDIYRYERTSLTDEVDPLKFFDQKP